MQNFFSRPEWLWVDQALAAANASAEIEKISAAAKQSDRGAYLLEERWAKTPDNIANEQNKTERLEMVVMQITFQNFRRETATCKTRRD